MAQNLEYGYKLRLSQTQLQAIEWTSTGYRELSEDLIQIPRQSPHVNMVINTNHFYYKHRANDLMYIVEQLRNKIIVRIVLGKRKEPMIWLPEERSRFFGYKGLNALLDSAFFSLTDPHRIQAETALRSQGRSLLLMPYGRIIALPDYTLDRGKS